MCISSITLLVAAGPVLAGFRSLDGSGNNPNYGGYVTDTQVLRKAAAAYTDGISSPAFPGFPNARKISNDIFSQTGGVPDERGLTEMVWVWGQFIDHDLDHTPLQSGGETLDITIPVGDAVYTPGSVIPVSRSLFDPATGTSTANPRQQINTITPWLDAGMVYGGKAGEPNNGLDRANWLRTFSDGQLKVTPHATGDLLPTKGADASAPGMAMDAVMGAATFIAGDVRANEHAALTAMQTVFVREHNRLAQFIATTHGDLPDSNTNPSGYDEEIYQRARKIVGAEVQAITYNEFLPIMGVFPDPYSGAASPGVDPRITNEFATSAYRMGHSQINDVMLRLDENGQTIAEGNLNLAEAFFDPSRITDEGGIEPVLRGLAGQVQEATDTLMTDGIRNLLFTGMPPGGPIANGTDLAALDIQRARDHGLDHYNATRVAYGLPVVSSFGEITDDAAMAAALTALYGHPDTADQFVVALAERHPANSSLGELVQAVLKDQFERVRDGDAFWYEIDPDLQTWPAPEIGASGTVLDWLNHTYLSDVIMMNSSMTNMRHNIFVIPEPASLSAMFVVGGMLLRRRR